MLQSIFRNMQPVVKNLLILNLLFFLANFIFDQKGIHLADYLGLHYIGSNDFKPYQLATHFFMHADFRHILFNMFAMVVFGNMLERIWGAKRFLIFYFATALGAAFLHQLVQGIEIYSATDTFFPNHDYINSLFSFRDGGLFGPPDLHVAYGNLNAPTVGASGAVFGVLIGAAMYFPNTEMMLYFAFRVKLKWIVLGAGVYEIISIMQDNPGDNVAHFAHIGGALFGFIIIKIWQRNKTQLY
ncbi:MAG: rhomboid family intramembrane serine protease [Crocinitomix sp.]|nr:rhomboid family intramembrane serine protease [Crocinitomix sp.]